jgi:hypothetical protein
VPRTLPGRIRRRGSTLRTEGLTVIQKAHADTQAAAKRNEIMISTIAGALTSDQAEDVLQAADRRIKYANL